jgi:RNA polymerase sigma factor (sigma-70 family)
LGQSAQDPVLIAIGSKAIRFEVIMKDELSDATSATLLGRVRLSPGDAAAWDRFVGVYGPKIRGWCKRWGLQEADSEDVTQDVLLRMAQRMRTFTYDPARSFRGWLHTVTKNALAEFLSHRKRQCAGSGDDRVLELLESVPAREDLLDRLKDQFDSEMLAEAFARAQARVGPHTWKAFQLMTRDGLSGEEVARQLGMNVASVFKAKSRVLEHLREELKRLEGDG